MSKYYLIRISLKLKIYLWNFISVCPDQVSGILAGNLTQLVECLPGKCKVLGLVPSIPQTEKVELGASDVQEHP